MPAALYADMERSGSVLEEQRAFQLALELSKLGLQPPETQTGDICGFPQNHNLTEIDGRTQKKSQNTTECVPVPSSEHVAEIVGRQGCKIKALRAKTNTYIKTPVRGEEPVFVVTGRREDVNAAKKEILSAAEHFSSIRAQRKSNGLNAMIPGPNSNMPGQTTSQVRVPYRVVGLVVGPKGATIKRIQQLTNTYIVTPSREKEPVFEVTGLPANVETARQEIEAHIASRTGGNLHEHGSQGSITDDDSTHFCGTLGSNGSSSGAGMESGLQVGNGPLRTMDSFAAQDAVFGRWSTMIPQRQSVPNVGTRYPFPSKLYPSMSFFEQEDEPTFDSMPVWPDFAPNGRLTNSSGSQSSTEGSLDFFRYGAVGNVDRVSPTDSLGSAGRGPGAKINTSVINANCMVTRGECIVCSESEVVAALVPCGHNLFCLECANRLVASPKPDCPVCRERCTQAVRIRN